MLTKITFFPKNGCNWNKKYFLNDNDVQLGKEGKCARSQGGSKRNGEVKNDCYPKIDDGPIGFIWFSAV